MKTTNAISMILIALCATSASAFFASKKADLTPFLGTYNLVSSSGGTYCMPSIEAKIACEGIKFQNADKEITSQSRDFCKVDQGKQRNTEASSGGHGIIPSIDYSSVNVTYNEKEKTLKKVDFSRSFTIVIFTSTAETTAQLETPNQLVITSKYKSNASDETSTCVYMRQ